MASRPEMLTGATYNARTHEGAPLFITVNDLNGEPYEVFIRIDKPELFEWMIALTLMITRSLRAGETLNHIADELLEVHSPVTRHVPKGQRETVPSLAARIGQVLKEHAKTYSKE